MKTNKIIFNFLVIIFLISSINCMNNKKDRINKTIMDSSFICDTTKFSRTLSAINENPQKFIQVNKLNDHCILRMVDTLVALYISESKIEYLVGLENLFKNSDGYLTDYFSDVGIKLFRENFINFFDYIYSKKDTGEISLEKLLIYSALDEIEYKHSTKDEIDKLFNEKLESDALTDNEKNYLKGIKKRIDIKLKNLKN